MVLGKKDIDQCNKIEGTNTCIYSNQIFDKNAKNKHWKKDDINWCCENYI